LLREQQALDPAFLEMDSVLTRFVGMNINGPQNVARKMRQEEVKRQVTDGIESLPPISFIKRARSSFVMEEEPTQPTSVKRQTSGEEFARPASMPREKKEKKSKAVSKLETSTLATGTPTAGEALVGMEAMAGDSQEKPKRGQHISCHQCKTTKRHEQLMFCTSLPVGKKRRCRKKFCDACLRRSHFQVRLCPFYVMCVCVFV